MSDKSAEQSKSSRIRPPMRMVQARDGSVSWVPVQGKPSRGDIGGCLGKDTGSGPVPDTGSGSGEIGQTGDRGSGGGVVSHNESSVSKRDSRDTLGKSGGAERGSGEKVYTPSKPLTLSEVREAQAQAVSEMRTRLRSKAAGPREVAETIRQLRLIEQEMVASEPAPVRPPMDPTRESVRFLEQLAIRGDWEAVTGGPMPPELLDLLRTYPHRLHSGRRAQAQDRTEPEPGPESG